MSSTGLYHMVMCAVGPVSCHVFGGFDNGR